MKKYDEYGIEKKSLNLRPYIALFVIVGIFLGLSFLILFNFDNIVNLFSKTEEKQQETEEKEQKQEFKLVDGLYEPELDNGNLYVESRDGYYFVLSKIEATKKGYELSFEVQNNSKYDYVYSYYVTRIQLDGYDVEGTIDFEDLTPGTSKKGTIIIKKTELDKLEINNFLSIKLYIKVLKDGKQVKDTTVLPVIRKKIDVDNSKNGLIEIYSNDKYSVSYYKKETDKDKHYLYFYLENSSKSDYDVRIQKILLDGSLYEPKQEVWSSLSNGKRIFVIEIPRDKYDEIKTMSISFIMESKSTKNNQEYYSFSPQKEVTL